MLATFCSSVYIHTSKFLPEWVTANTYSDILSKVSKMAPGKMSASFLFTQRCSLYISVISLVKVHFMLLQNNPFVPYWFQGILGNVSQGYFHLQQVGLF